MLYYIPSLLCKECVLVTDLSPCSILSVKCRHKTPFSIFYSETFQGFIVCIEYDPLLFNRSDISRDIKPIAVDDKVYLSEQSRGIFLEIDSWKLITTRCKEWNRQRDCFLTKYKVSVKTTCSDNNETETDDDDEGEFRNIRNILIGQQQKSVGSNTNTVTRKTSECCAEYREFKITQIRKISIPSFNNVFALHYNLEDTDCGSYYFYNLNIDFNPADTEMIFDIDKQILEADSIRIQSGCLTTWRCFHEALHRGNIEPWINYGMDVVKKGLFVTETKNPLMMNALSDRIYMGPFSLAFFLYSGYDCRAITGSTREWIEDVKSKGWNYLLIWLNGGVRYDGIVSNGTLADAKLKMKHHLGNQVIMIPITEDILPVYVMNEAGLVSRNDKWLYEVKKNLRVYLQGLKTEHR